MTTSPTGPSVGSPPSLAAPPVPPPPAPPVLVVVPPSMSGNVTAFELLQPAMSAAVPSSAHPMFVRPKSKLVRMAHLATSHRIMA
jgi:hypothetical protein